ncbi:MAG: type II secretion system protein [Sulfuricurvum sp.]|uniref:type II secretion system protein n=1 Tax=Sulfuricurvum sp. IAE1 TaxID=2546102 RepID=UPI001404BA2E|nr:type II secretion system protein [Sulfuricurvum sp. IAE1]
MRRAYTLIEIILTVAIAGILSMGMFKALEAIALRSEKAKALSTLSIDSQSALDQISSLLYNRIPLSAVGFDFNDSRPYRPLDEVNDKTILEWYGSADESYLSGDYSGFVDLNRSDFSTRTLYSPDTNLSALLVREKIKWNDPSLDFSDLLLLFSQTTFKGYGISGSLPNTITLGGTPPETIYEQYRIADSAYAITRKEHAAACFPNPAFDDDTLLLFYDYRPWKGENFCDGKVTVLATGVNAFRAQMLNGTIRLSIDMNRPVRGSLSPVKLSKQKVVF